MESPKLNNNQNVEVQIQSQKIEIEEVIEKSSLIKFLNYLCLVVIF